MEMRQYGMTHEQCGLELGKTSLACRLKLHQINKVGPVVTPAPRPVRNKMRRVRQARVNRNGNGQAASSSSSVQQQPLPPTPTNERRLLPATQMGQPSTGDFRHFPAVNSVADEEPPSPVPDVSPEARENNLREQYQDFLSNLAFEMRISLEEAEQFVIRQTRQNQAVQSTERPQPPMASSSSDRRQPAMRGVHSQADVDGATSLAQMSSSSRSRSSSGRGVPETAMLQNGLSRLSIAPGASSQAGSASFGSLSASSPIGMLWTRSRPTATLPANPRPSTPRQGSGFRDSAVTTPVDDEAKRRDSIRASMSFSNLLSRD